MPGAKNGEALLRYAKYVAAVTIVVTGGGFFYSHFASSQETEDRSRSTERIVNELQEIKLKQASADEQMRNMCEACVVTDKMECAKLGVNVSRCEK